MNQLKLELYKILESHTESRRLSRFFDYFFLFLIFFNILIIALETVESFSPEWLNFFRTSDMVITFIFLIEYLIRLWVCNLNPLYQSFGGRVRFMLSPMMIIDFLAIFPALIPMLITVDLKFLRILRFTRLFRLLKLPRYSKSLALIYAVIRNKKEELLITVFLSFILLILASFTIYYFEHDYQPQMFPNIPASLWWGVVTLTTVGYGDVYPVTIPGKCLGALISFLGIGMFALPAGILGSGFVEEISKTKGSMLCPHCGKEIEKS